MSESLAGPPVKVRFPPSPTGRKHIGNYRTMLFNWLFARSQGGEIVLRFEDTDPERSRRDWENGISETLKWLGLDWDEGPFRQTDRLELYRDAAARLQSAGVLYSCWCTQEELEDMRKRSTAAGHPPHFEHDAFCRARAAAGAGEGPAPMRFAVPGGSTTFVDLVKGEVTVDNATIGDRILVRANGEPVYQLAVTVDDHEMGITHVLRGEDLMPSTALQIQIARAIGRSEGPTFGHLPLIVGPDRVKLSTRHGPVALEDYKDDGLLAEALVNYMGLLGWSFPDGREVFTLEEMIESFSIDRVGSTPAMFDPVKLDSVNFAWIQRLDDDELAWRALPFFTRVGYSDLDFALLLRAISMSRERIKRLSELPTLIGFLFRMPMYDEAAWVKVMKPDVAPRLLDASLAAVESVPEPFAADAIGAAHGAAAEQLGVKLKAMQAPPRVAVTGSSVGPPLWESMELLGRDETIRRLRAARDRLS